MVLVESRSKSFRLDLATSLSDIITLIDAVERPEELFVSRGAKVATGVIIGICGTICMVCLVVLYAYRNDRAMTMAQGGLLGLLTMCALLGVLLSFLILPIKDGYCRLSSLCILPIGIIPNVMIGRLFRVYSTLGKAARLGKGSSTTEASDSLLLRQSRHAERQVMRVLSFFAFTRPFRLQKTRRGSSSLRQATTMHDTVRLIIVLSLPLTIIQVLKICFYDIRLDFQYDSDFKTGRFACDNSDAIWVIYLVLSMMVLQYMLCAFVAWCARDLPAAFNESTNIFKTAAISSIVSVVALALQAYLDDPSTSPSVSVS